jgi:hypothetical protein
LNIEFLVEEPSAEAALNYLVPKILGDRVTHRIHPHQGKKDLLKSLPGRMKGYRRWLPPTDRIVVLIDGDADDCRELKAQLDLLAESAGFSIGGRSGRRQGSCAAQCLVLNRIAIDELEAWFLGDVEAVRKAYPRVPSGLGEKRGYRNPDVANSKASERLERVLQEVGEFREGLRKIEVARRIAAHMDPGRNRSPSFQVFRDGLLAICREDL